MKALNVHGGGAVFDRTSCKVGRRGQYGPEGIDRLRGLEGRKSPDDMKPSSSASQSERTDEQRGDVSLDDVCRYNDGGFRYFDCFDLRIALRRYFMGNGDLPPAVNELLQLFRPLAIPNIIPRKSLFVPIDRDHTVLECYRAKGMCRKVS